MPALTFQGLDIGRVEPGDDIVELLAALIPTASPPIITTGVPYWWYVHTVVRKQSSFANS